ncbi:NAD-dependent epimerase/dehydratase [Penicillium malachiteum]|uniref:NAD-dependent epimerase/dehydratase n=1 Tax=Penicillium malachiteum TaxID=1324776 RepID=UPI002548814C|nr:NAD-dependent epimerase/dehydratase [Penicillium malachiteum]KAJ5718874.1 NAD-dependent epimerase/dehydratase [Penicillium malachiteum]
MSRELIFLTGASGYIGSATALEALRRGYRLRLCLRKPCERLTTLLSAYLDHVQFVFVPDLADEAALEGKLDGANYIIHIASPLPRGVDKTEYFSPAVNVTTTILREATRVPTIKKAVVTSSLAALVPMTGVPAGTVMKDDNDWDLGVNEAADFTIPGNPAATALNIYHASKLLSNKATWDFWKNENPHYGLVVLYPGYTFGYNPMQMTAEDVKNSSNGGFWEAIMESTQNASLNCVHIDDVVDAHLMALDGKVLDGSKYLLAPNKATWKEVADIVHRDYPSSGSKITGDMKGEACVPFVQIDCSKSEVDLGLRWRSMEQMVHDVMDQQLGMRCSLE